MEKGSTSSKLAIFVVGSWGEAPAKAKNEEGAQQKTWGRVERTGKSLKRPVTHSRNIVAWLRRAGICPPFVIDSSGRLQQPAATSGWLQQAPAVSSRCQRLPTGPCHPSSGSAGKVSKHIETPASSYLDAHYILLTTVLLLSSQPLFHSPLYPLPHTIEKKTWNFLILHTNTFECSISLYIS